MDLVRVALGACVALGLLAAPGAAQPAASAEAGRPVVRNFLPQDYEGHNQVFYLAEGANGYIYAAVYGQVVEYDGRTWQRIPVSTSWIRCLAAAPDGGILVAATDQLGVCRPGPDGATRFESWLSRLPARLQPTGPL